MDVNSILHCGIGAVVITRGDLDGKPCLFLAPAKEPGQPGMSSDREELPEDELVDGEVVLTFPTEDQALQVRDLLCFTGFAAMAEVAGERRRQIETENFSTGLDDAYYGYELAKAAAAYVGHACIKDQTRRANEAKGYPPGVWPWSAKWWKPTTRRRDLVKAAALIIAEIERIDRAEARAGE